MPLLPLVHFSLSLPPSLLLALLFPSPPLPGLFSFLVCSTIPIIPLNQPGSVSSSVTLVVVDYLFSSSVIRLLLIARFSCALLTIVAVVSCLVHSACDSPLSFISRASFLRLSFQVFSILVLLPSQLFSSPEHHFRHQHVLETHQEYVRSRGLCRASPVNILNRQLLRQARYRIKGNPPGSFDTDLHPLFLHIDD